MHVHSLEKINKQINKNIPTQNGLLNLVFPSFQNKLGKHCSILYRLYIADLQGSVPRAQNIIVVNIKKYKIMLILGDEICYETNSNHHIIICIRISVDHKNFITHSRYNGT